VNKHKKRYFILLWQ